MSKSTEVELYTDGACSGNPGPGGWAFILRHAGTGKELEGSGGEEHTTNNRMELTAVIEGLQTLKRPCHVELFTDSVYVGKGHDGVDVEMETRMVGVDARKTVGSQSLIANFGRAWIGC